MRRIGYMGGRAGHKPAMVWKETTSNPGPYGDGEAMYVCLLADECFRLPP